MVNRGYILNFTMKFLALAKHSARKNCEAFVEIFPSKKPLKKEPMCMGLLELLNAT